MARSNLAVAYARYSPRPGVAECDSIAVQQNRMRSYASHMGLDIAAMFEDPEVSARKTKLIDREGGRRMLGYVDEHKIKNIITLRIDRIFRDARDGVTTVADLREKGISLHFADQGGATMCTHTAVGQLIFTVLLGIAQFEPELTAERTSQGLALKQANGKRVSGNPPYGWYVDARSPKTLIPDPYEQRVIGVIDQLRIAAIPAVEIATVLNFNGLRTRNGNRWTRRHIESVIDRQNFRNGVPAVIPRQLDDSFFADHPEVTKLFAESRERIVNTTASVSTTMDALMQVAKLKFGLKYRDETRTHMVAHPQEILVVKDILKRVSRGVRHREICEYLLASKTPYTEGREWTPGRVRRVWQLWSRCCETILRIDPADIVIDINKMVEYISGGRAVEEPDAGDDKGGDDEGTENEFVGV